MPITYRLVSKNSSSKQIIILARRGHLPTGQPVMGKLSVYFYQEEVLGKGAEGSVFAAVMHNPSKISINFPSFVIKRGSCDDDAYAKMLKKSGEFFARIHGGPVFFKFIKEENEYIQVLKRLPGVSLHRLFADVDIPRLAKLKVLQQTFAKLQDFHKKGFFHGDFKAGNVLVDRKDKENSDIYFVDFSYSRLLGEKALTWSVDNPEEIYFHNDLLCGQAAVAMPFYDFCSFIKCLKLCSFGFDSKFLVAIYDQLQPELVADQVQRALQSEINHEERLQQESSRSVNRLTRSQSTFFPGADQLPVEDELDGICFFQFCTIL